MIASSARYFLIETSLVKKYRAELAIMMSCKRSIKANHRIDDHSARQLLYQLSQCDNPYNCPHGRPVLVHFTKSDIEKEVLASVGQVYSWFTSIGAFPTAFCALLSSFSLGSWDIWELFVVLIKQMLCQFSCQPQQGFSSWFFCWWDSFARTNVIQLICLLEHKFSSKIQNSSSFITRAVWFSIRFSISPTLGGWYDSPECVGTSFPYLTW